MMLSKVLSQFTVNLQYKDLPENVVEMCKIAIIDWLGSVLAGATQPPARKITNVIRGSGGNPEATIIGCQEKTSVMGAALVNGAAAHILEMDDLHRSSILHPAAPIISAAVALAEREKIDGKNLITAIVAGYEVGIRIAEAVTPSHYYYWHTTGTCGTFGATIAAAKVYKLDEGQIVNALGSAGSQASGLWEFIYDGAMTKHLHPGKAAMNGIIAVLLAKEGFTGATKILEGKKGFFRASAEKFDVNKTTKDLGKVYRILSNSYKIYPSCRHTHGGVDLALDLKKGGLAPENVEKIVIKTYSIAKDLVGNLNPKAPYEAKFSLPFCVASALINGKLILNSFDEDVIDNTETRALMSRCTIEADPQIDALYPAKWPTKLEVLLHDGNTINVKTEYPKGDPENPASAKELKDKFKELAALSWSSDRVDMILEDLQGLETIDDVSNLFEQGRSIING